MLALIMFHNILNMYHYILKIKIREAYLLVHIFIDNYPSPKIRRKPKQTEKVLANNSPTFPQYSILPYWKQFLMTSPAHIHKLLKYRTVIGQGLTPIMSAIEFFVLTSTQPETERENTRRDKELLSAILPDLLQIRWEVLHDPYHFPPSL